MQRNRMTMLAVPALALLSLQAHAIITYEFQGAVTEIRGTSTQFAIGDAITGHVYWSPETAAQETQHCWSHIFTFDYSFAGLSVASSGLQSSAVCFPQDFWDFSPVEVTPIDGFLDEFAFLPVDVPLESITSDLTGTWNTVGDVINGGAAWTGQVVFKRVPEPSTLILFGGGLLGLLFLRSRARSWHR